MNSSHTFHIDPGQRPEVRVYDAPAHPPFTSLILGDLGTLTLILHDTPEHAAWLRDLANVAGNLAELVEARSLDGAA